MSVCRLLVGKPPEALPRVILGVSLGNRGALRSAPESAAEGALPVVLDRKNAWRALPTAPRVPRVLSGALLEASLFWICSRSTDTQNETKTSRVFYFFSISPLSFGYFWTIYKEVQIFGLSKVLPLTALTPIHGHKHAMRMGGALHRNGRCMSYKAVVNANCSRNISRGLQSRMLWQFMILVQQYRQHGLLESPNGMLADWQILLLL